MTTQLNQSQLIDHLPTVLGDALLSSAVALDEITCEIDPARIREVCVNLRDDPATRFETLIDLCGMDYSAWGGAGLEGDEGIEGGEIAGGGEGIEGGEDAGGDERIESGGGDERIAGDEGGDATPWHGHRFAVVYHLLSLHHNHRLRLRVALDEAAPAVDSVVEVWPAADWYEREAFDLFGILFHGHPDLRRLLTDYGFIGHPFRKDFPLTGQVEMRYDEEHGRVVYQPATIEPRTLVPRTFGKPVDRAGG